jgi:hypothetical protein
MVSGDATLLIYDPRLLQVVDGWVAGVDDETFDDVLPLLRRTFSAFSEPERREIGEQVTRIGGSVQAGNEDLPDLAAAGPAVRTMARYLGWEVVA